MKRFVFFSIILLLAGIPLRAKIINVPRDFAEIQKAIDAATQGDTVLVAPGIYLGKITLENKNIVLASHYLLKGQEAYIHATLLQLQDTALSIIRCKNVSQTTVITGFTIGAPNFKYGGIRCQAASPQIRHNVFTTYKDAISCVENSAPLISDNVFRFENASPNLVTVHIFSGRAKIINNIFKGNNAGDAIRIGASGSARISGNRISAFHAGIRNFGQGTRIINNLISDCYYGLLTVEALILNNTVVHNSFGLANWSNDALPEIKNCILWDNERDLNGNFAVAHSCLQICLPYSAIDRSGNIFRNPEFVNPQGNDFHLKGYSPCIDAGISEEADSLPKFDLDGQARIQDGTGEGEAVVDMGCFERAQATNPAFVTGKVTLNGGHGKPQDVWVGIGTMVHPRPDGTYQLAISAPDSFYTVTAQLDSYLTQRVENVPVHPGETTANINFSLGYYHPQKVLDIRPDTIRFLSWDDGDQAKIYFHNISLEDVCVRSARITDANTFFYIEPFALPLRIAPGDSDSLSIGKMILTRNSLLGLRETDSTAVIIYFEGDSALIPIVYNPDLFDAVRKPKPIISSFRLLPNFPNPFNKRTTVTFNTDRFAFISLEIFNVSGQRVRKLVHTKLPAGRHSVRWDGKDDRGLDLPSGLYLARLKTTNRQRTIKMILLK